MHPSYPRLEALFKQLNDIDGAIAVLHWDSAVIMPGGGAPVRGEQLSTLTSLRHSMLVSKQVEELLAEAGQHATHLDSWQQANLREMQRRYIHASAVEGELLTALTRATSECEHMWRSARAANDFKNFAPHLANVLALTREMAAAKAEKLGCSPYDALLDSYDPGRKSTQIDAIFADLAGFLPGFIAEAQEHQRRQPLVLPLEGAFPVEKQRGLGIKAMQALGFDFNCGRLDVSHHPFCGGVPSDIRITTRYNEKNFIPALMGVLHETGHALYEHHLPEAWRSQPVGQALGMSIHESQSLLVEMQLCRGRDFITFIQPHIAQAFGGTGAAWETDNLYRHMTQVRPSLIRVDADEATYPAHVILRYRLERAMIAGDLSVPDLPGAWSEGMQALLGVVPDSDKDGCMQDVHWPGGDFGYFPTYTLGAIIAAQIFATAKQALPDIADDIRRGDFAPLVLWLKTNIHAHGSYYAADEMLEKSTGRAIDVENYKQYLRGKYLG